MSLTVWFGFLAASLAISLSPGPGAFASMSAGLRNGFGRGYWVVVGLQLGIVAILSLVAAGVGSLIVSSRPAFELLRWAGVAYLAWLGLTQWRSETAALAADESASPQSRRALLLRGFLVDTTNPKALLFLMAVVPQFINPEAPLLPQYGILTATIVVIDMVVMAVYTLLAARVLALLRQPRQVRTINRGFGVLFLGAAVGLALFRRG